ncbi:hypothetical protein BJV74DRAFT_799479, partial [Russula compacta]
MPLFDNIPSSDPPDTWSEGSLNAPTPEQRIPRYTGGDNGQHLTQVPSIFSILGVVYATLRTGHPVKRLIYEHLQRRSVRSVANKEEALTEALLVYLKSPGFKENVTSKLQCMLLEPKLSPIRPGCCPSDAPHPTQPGNYRVPLDLQNFIPSNAFAAA